MRAKEIFRYLQEAWECSSVSRNLFYPAICQVNWDDKFYADGEYYFVKDDMVFVTPTLDPFSGEDWKPSATFSNCYTFNF